MTRAHSSLGALAADEGRPAEAAAHWARGGRARSVRVRRHLRARRRAGPRRPAAGRRAASSSSRDERRPRATPPKIAQARAWLAVRPLTRCPRAPDRMARARRRSCLGVREVRRPRRFYFV